MKKNSMRLLSFLLATLMVIAMFPAGVFAEDTSNGVNIVDSGEKDVQDAEKDPVEIPSKISEAELVDNGSIKADDLTFTVDEATLTATVTDGKSASGEVVIPSAITYDGKTYAVTAVASNAFNDANEVTKVTVPNSVTSLGGAAFANMDKLTEIVIGNGVTSWGSKLAVNNSELTTVVLAEGATLIGDLAFRTCPKLANVTLPSTLKTIGATAFTYSAITELTVPASVVSIGSDSFKDIDTLKKVTFLGADTKLGSTCFQMCDGLEEVILPANLKSIPQGAFRYCTALKTIDFPETLTEIGNYSFQGCTSLESVTISKNITNLVTNAFNGCTSLKNLTIEEGFNGTIGGYVFQGCTALESVVIPSSMETVGESMFNMCSSLKDVTLSEGVKTLNISAFANCTSLETLVLPDSLERMRHGSIANCTALKTLVVTGDNLPVIEHSNALTGLSDDLVIVYNGDDAFTGNWAALADNPQVSSDAVALIGTQSYETLADAIAAANAIEGGATVTLLKNVTLSEKLTIKKNITISGAYTITRGIAGTIFAVDKNATLTLDGGVIIDGGNNWTFDSEGYYADMAAGLTLSTGAKDSYSTSAEGGLVATAQLITISGIEGAVVMNNATIQNTWGSPLFAVPAGATLTMNDGSLIQHVRGQLINALNGSWVMEGGKITDVHAHNVNGGLVDMRGSSTFTINDGEICYVTVLGLNANGNGILAQVYGDSTKLTINGGNIHDNASFSPGKGWGSVVYLNRGGDFEMNGGTIEHTASDHCTAFVSNTSTSIVLNAGTIIIEESKAANFDSLIYGDTVIGENMKIEGDGLVVLLGDPGDTFENNGVIDSDMQICYGEVTGNGTYNGDVIVKADDYFEFDGKVVISGGNWNGTITVEEGAELSITGGIFKYDPSAWAADGYKVAKLADGTYGVAEDPAYGKVAQVGDEYYETLKEAIAAANAIEGGATVTLLADVTLGEKLTITGNVTISGEYTITRADTYTGNLFTVNAGATLTLDGGLVIDGNNNWTLNEELYNKALALEVTGVTWAELITSEEGKPNANAPMFKVTGALVANNVTIQNNYSNKSSNNGDYGVFQVDANATLTMTGATVKHIVTGGANSVAHLSTDSVWTINEGTLITDTFAAKNGGICRNDSGKLVMNGGEISGNKSINTNGVVVMLYKGSMEMNGGKICSNSGISGTANGRCAPIYGHSTSTFIMKGGEICHNTGISYGGVDVPSSIKVEISGGYVGENISVLGNTNADVNGNANTVITGGTFTQDVSKWLAPNTGLEYVNGQYTVIDEKLFKLHLTDSNTGEPATIPYLEGSNLADLVAYGKLFYADYYKMTLEVLYDVKIDKTVVIDYPMTIDLNGHTLTADTSMDSTPVIRVVADVTVTGEGKIDGRPGTSSYAFIVGQGENAGNLTIENGTFYGSVTAVSVTKGTATINGGNFAADPYMDDGEENYNFLLNCIDASYKDGTAKIFVKGGTFYKFNPADNAAEGAGTSFVAENYLAEADGDYYTVRVNKDTLPKVADVVITLEGGQTITLTYPSERFDTIQKLIGTNDYADFVMGAEQSELLAYVANGDVTEIVMNLYDDIALDAPINFYNKYFQVPATYDITINGNNNTITWADGYNGTLINVESGVGVTLNKLNIFGENTFSFYDDTTTVEDGQNWYTRFVDVGEEDKAINANVIVNAGDLTLNRVTIAGVTIASDGDSGKTANSETGGYYLMYNDDLAIIKSNGGTVALNDSRIDNNAGLILNAINAKTEINGTGITNNMGAGNKGGIIIANGGTMSIKDATINNNKAMARSATILGVTGGAEVSFNGLSAMDNNKHIGVGSNTAGAMIVLEGASQFVMNGGSISNNIGGRAGAIASRWVGGSYGQHEETSIVLNAGTIKGNTASNDSWNGADIFLRSPATIGAGMKVDGTIAVNAAPAELDITGGTFTNFELIVTDGLSAEITGGTFDNDPSEWLADGYVAPKNDDGTYTARVQSYVEWVKEQLLAGNDVTLTEDIVITDYDLVNAIPLPSNGNGKYNEAHGNGAVFHIIKPGVELDLNGHSITWDAHDDAYCNKRQVSLFMVTATGVAGETADFTIKDSVGTGKVDVYGMGSGVYVVLKTAKATVAGGTWTNYPCKTCGASNIFMYPSHGGTLEITGGTFEQKDSEYLLGCFGSTKETTDNGVGVDYDSTQIIISGGTFVGFNPENVKFIDFANAGAESEINGCELGLMANDNGDGTYGVKEWDLVVRNTEDLVRFAAMVNAGNTFAGKTVVLGADIDLAGLNWTPIGNDTNYFCGTFDGQDHTISNMTINVNTPDANQFVGLFGGVKKATIKNLTMTNVNIDVVGAKVRAAAVVGIAHSNSENRTDAAINFENITVNGCTINAEAKSGSALIGGVVGYCYPANLANINVSDLTIDAKAEGNEVRAAAILGYLCGQNISNNGNTRAAMLVDTFNVENVSITANAYTVFAGGFAPYTYYGYITIKDGTIDGLEIDVDAHEAFVGGLVGYFWRSDNGHNVENVHITDIDFDVTTDYLGETRVGGMVGTSQSPNTKYTDCSVSGKIVERCSDPEHPVNYHAKVGGFVARTYEYAQQTYTNCVADVDITASHVAGGFVGNHDSTVSYVNCVAKGDVTANIAGGFAGRLTEHNLYTTDVTFQGCESHGNVTGTNVAGGFIGSTVNHGWAPWAAGNGTPYGKNVTIKDCTVTGTVTSGTDYRAGVVGEAVMADGKYLSLVNVSYVVEPACYPNSESIKNYVIELTDAEGNKILYAELADAIADAQSGYTITLLDNVSLTAPVTVPAGKAITLDLGDYTLSYTSDVAGEAMITNNGELTVVGEGAIVYTYTGAADSAYTKGNYTINNSGKLVIDGATVQNATAAMSHAYYAVNNGNGGEIILKSGLIENLTNYGVRLFGKGSLTVDGGEIKGTRAVWIQAPGSNTADAPAISLTVNDGTLTATGENGGYKLAVYSYNYGNSPANINITVTGGVIDGDIALTGGANKTATESVTVTGGIINDIYSYAEDEVAKNTVNVSGGTFNVRVYDAYLADGFIPTENDDGTYSVVEGKYVAEINGEKYGIVDAIKHWTDGTTMTLIADVTLPDVIKLSSTEKHILNLGSFTMTAASGKDAIQIVNNGRSNAGFALEINADATNPGGITAKGKAIVRTTGKSGVKDRPIIVFNGGVFNASNIVSHSGSSGTNCPQFRFYGGEYTGSISANRAMFWFYGGKFNSSLFISVDSSAYAMIAGGEFKELRNWYGSALNADKFTIGSAKGVFDREVYINNDGYYVVVPTLPAGIQAAATITTGTNDYLYYSKIGAKGLMYYTDVNMALSANNKTSGEVFVYVDTIDLSALNYKGTMVITDSLTVTYNEGTTPAWTVKAADAGKFVYVKETVANGVVTAVYTVGEMPVAKIGTQFFATLAEAIDAAQSGDTIILVADVTENVTVDENLTIDGGSFDYTGTMTLKPVNVTIQNVDFVKGNVYKHKSTGIGGNYVIKNCTFDGQNSVNYAIDLGGTTAITVENCTAKDYSYGFLQVPATNNSVTVKGVTVSGVNYGVKIDYSNGVTLEDVNITANVAGVLNSTFGAKTITIKNSTINSIVTWVRNATFQQTVVFEGANTVGDLSETDLTTLKLADGATLTAPAGLTVITDKADHKVVYENGTYKVIAKVYVAEVNGVKYESLQAAIDACVVGNNTITLLNKVDEDVTIKQVEGVNITINGAFKTYSGTITIHGNARYTGAETLTIKNVKFVTDEAGHYFIDSNSTGSVERYAHNVTVEGCQFVAEGAAINSAAAVRIRQGFNIKLVKNLSENLHSLFQGYGCAGFSAEANRITGKNGISVGTSTGVQIIGNEIVATGYGVRADGTSESDMFFEANTITAELPLVIRNVTVTGSYELTMGLKSTLNASNAEGYQIVFTQGDDGTYIDCTGNFKLIKNAAHEYEVYPFDAYVAFVGDRGYVSLQDAINACKNGETVKLVADITYDADDIVFAHGGATGFGNYDHYNPSIIYVGGTKGETPAQNLPSDVNVVIDLNGHTITNNADAYLFLFMDNCRVTFTDSLGDGKIISHSTSYPSIWACGTDTLVTIEKGYYVTDSALGLLHATHSGDLVIYGGEFKTTAEDASLLIMLNSQKYNNPNYFLKGVATVTIYGGIFHGFNPNYVGDDYGASSIEEIKFVDGCAENYEPVDNGDGTFGVVPTKLIKVEVEMMPGAWGTSYITVENWADLVAALGEYTNLPIKITLLDNVEITEPLVISGNKTVVINLNGKTMTGVDVYPVIRVQGGADVTVTGNGSIINETDYVFVLGSADKTTAGNLTIENGTFIGSTTVASVTKGILTVKGGYFETNGDEYGATYLLNCIDESYRNGTASIIVTGGTFAGFDPANNAAEGAGTNFVAKGYKSVGNSDGSFTVEANKIFEIHLTDANGEAHWLSPMSSNDLAAALSHAKVWYESLQGTYDFTLKILGDWAVDSTVIVDFPLTIDLGDYTISAEDTVNTSPVFRILSDVTVKNGTVDGRGGSSCYAFIVGNSTTAGSLTIVDGTYYGDVSAVSVTNGTLTVEGGYFEGTEYNGAHEFTLNCIDSAYNNGNAVIVVKGGTFYKFNPENNAAEGVGTDFVHDDYKAYAEGENYTVKKVVVTIGSVEDLLAFTAAVTGNTEYQGVKVAANPDAVVLLTADLDLTDSGFAGIGNGAANAFSGTFDGQNHTISNMTLSCNYYRGVGFFRSLGKGAVIKNLTFENADVNNGAATGANHFYGVVAGFSNDLTLDNVNVIDSKVTCKYAGSALVGCLEGATTVKNCDIENVTLRTDNTRGAVFGILGNSANGHTIVAENNTVTDFSFIVNDEFKAAELTLGYGAWNAGNDYAEERYVAQIGDTKYSTLANAIAAAKDGDTITLIGDVTRAATLIVDKDVTIDFNGHTVYGSEHITNAPVIRVLADVTVKNGTVDGRDGFSCYAFIVGNGTTAGSLTIVDGTYYGDVSVVSVTNGTLTVEGGYFEGTEYNGAHEFTLNCIDANYNNGSASIVVKGGSFYGFNPENNAAEGANTNFVAEGYGVNVADSVYTVVKAVVEMDGKYYATIKDALATLSSSDTTVHTVKVLQDHDIDVNYSTYNYPILVNGFSIVLDLNGKTINADWSKYAGSRKDNALIGLANGGKLTVTGNGTINNLSDGKDDVENRIFWLSNAHSTKESVLTIENGTFNQYEDINLLYVEGITASSNKKGYFTYIKGGEFNMLDPNFTDFFNSYDGRKQETVLTGGIFSHDPTDPEMKIHEDFRVRALSNGKWKVVPLVTVVFDDFTIVDGNELPEFTYTTNFNDVAEDGTMLIVPNPVVNVNGAGEYDITSDAYVFMSEDYVVEVTAGTLTVQKAALSVDGVFFTDLDSAIPSIKRNSVIKLYDDIEYGKTVVDGSNKFVELKLKPNLGDLVIDLNGHDLTFHFTATIQYGTTLTIKDSSGVPGTIRNTNGSYPFVINPQTVVNLVDGVNFDCTIQMNCTSGLSGYFQIDGKNVIGETDSLFVAGNSYIRLALKQNYLYVETIAGTLTLAEDWKTLAGQTVVIGGSTGVTVAEGVTLTIDPTTQLTIKGYLNGEGTVVVNTLEHFEQIMATDIKNIEIGSTIVLSEDYVLDLAGKKITSSEGVNPAFRVTDGAKVTVKNADMDTAGYAFILGASDGSSAGYLTIENGKFHSVTTVVSVTNGKLTVLDGEFSVTPYNGNYAYLLNCIDANYSNGTASIEISGGIFHNWDPEDNAAEGKNTNFVADRHASVEIDENVWKVVDVIDVTVTLDDKTMVIGNAQPEYTYSLSDATLADVIKVTFNAINVTAVGTYDITATIEADSLYNVTVVDATLTVVDAVAQIGSASFASLRDALNAAEDGNTIVILKDHAMDGTDVVNDTVYGYDNLAILDGVAVTLDFNGHTVSVKPDCDANDDNALKNCLESVIFVANGGSLTVTDTVGNGGFYVTKGTNLYCLIYNSEGSTVTVKNGNFYVEETVQSGAVIYADANNTTSIEGGNFTLVNAGTFDDTKPWITNVQGKNSGNFVQVTGGTFNQDPYLNRFTAKDWEVNVPENFAIVNNGNGTWSVVPAVVYIEEDYIPGYKTGYATLADALAAVENGETIVFVKNFSENVTIKQKKDLSFTINGNGKIFGGTITIDGAGRIEGEETLTITNVNFLAETSGQSSIITKKSSFAHNVTIDGCTFTGTDAQNAYGITLQHAYDITVKNVTGTKLYDLVYGKFAVTGFVAENVTVTETGTGFWFTSVKNASFKNVNVKAANAIGVKNAMSSTMTFENCSFEAEIPVYMWLSTADVSYAMVFNGTNSMVATNGGSWLVIKETASADFKVTLNDTGLDAAGIDTVVAMIGDNVYYNSVAYAVKDAQDGETVVVIADDTSAKDIIANNSVTLDLNGFDVTGNLTVNGNLTIIDSTVDEAAKNYDDAGHLNGTVTVADGATLTLYAGIYTQNVDEYCADHYLARDNKNGTWTVCRGVVFNKTYGTSFLTIADAMANAMTTAGKDHIVLLEDHFENIVIVYDNTILDLGTFDLTTNYVIVFKGGNLTGNTYSSTNDHGKLIVAQRDTNVIFDGEGYINANGYTVLPTWDDEQGCYVFSYFVMTTSGGNRGFKYDVENDTARVTFKIQTGGSTYRDLLMDGIANHGINFVLTVTCKKDGNAVTQDYFYSDELLLKCVSTTSNLTFQLGNVSSLSDVTFEVKVVSETGAYQTSGVVTLAECEQ